MFTIIFLTEGYNIIFFKQLKNVNIGIDFFFCDFTKSQRIWMLFTFLIKRDPYGVLTHLATQHQCIA